MSVTSLLADPRVVSILRPIVPEFPAAPASVLRVSPKSKEFALVGQAADYAIRFELLRRNPDAVSFPWVAVRAVEATLPRLAPELVPSAQAVINDASSFVRDYTRIARPGGADRQQLASACVQLAKLESIYRQGEPREDFATVEPDTALDVLRILAITPFEEFEAGRPLLLNPTFGAASLLVGNADADLIAGDLLLDLKSTTRADVLPEHGMQLMSYVILAREAARRGLSFPEIKRVGILFTRYGRLVVADIEAAARGEEFRRVEREYLDYAARKPSRAGSS